jgi:glycosyltransferase involved in cell wall biosynthesis
MRFSILTQYYPPEIGAPQRRLSELATRMAKRGWDVDVLTALPSYPKGAIFPGYQRRLVMQETLGDVDVVRSFVYPSQSAAIVPRLANYFSFVASSALVGTAKLPRSEYLLVESPPLFLGMSGLLLAKAKRARLIFNVSDLWPESAVRLGVVRRESAMVRAAEKLEALCYRAAWLVTGQSKTILDDIERRHPRARTYHLSNGCDTETYGERFRTEKARALLLDDAAPDRESFVVVYAGLHGIAQGLEQILDAAARIHDPRVRFVLVGDGPDRKKLIAQAEARGLRNVRFLEPVPAADVAPLLASADAIAVTLKMDIPGAVPSKIYESMASEKPVILAASGEAAEIVRSADAGVVVAPGDVEGFARAVVELAKNPARARALGENGRRAAVAKYDRRQIAEKFMSYLEAN